MNYQQYLNLKPLFEKQKKNYSVYCLINHTKKAIYFGVTNNFINRIQKHINNEVKATKYWVFDKNDIDKIIIERELTQKKASELAHVLEKQKFKGFEDYKVIQTAGI